ncbi:hypothetical protein BN970_01345 [Mycolicibacterium conceptionense]|uniref:Uncharacterized protein n=1 Tax=Mycolicibacterium conceptionense TaxID=451644 RepID=A0A0U1D360_9MYCO|nr:hypothetical protein [Mycolicibacterium conceptionense]CQD07172.1 hypothetical protein BN970_01345 [Mycolicibacterium conceptionense]
MRAEFVAEGEPKPLQTIRPLVVVDRAGRRHLYVTPVLIHDEIWGPSIEREPQSPTARL